MRWRASDGREHRVARGAALAFGQHPPARRAALRRAVALGPDRLPAGADGLVRLAQPALRIVIPTALVGTGFWLAAGLLGPLVALAWALVFGALISATDPVAVLATLKAVRAPPTLETDMAGESLFNGSVGAVVFTALLAVASGGE